MQGHRSLRRISSFASPLRAVIWLADARWGGDHAGSVSGTFSALASWKIAPQPSRVDVSRGAQPGAEAAQGESAVAGPDGRGPRDCRAAVGLVTEPRRAGVVGTKAKTSAGGSERTAGRGPMLPAASRGRSSLSRNRSRPGHLARSCFYFLGAITWTTHVRRQEVTP